MPLCGFATFVTLIDCNHCSFMYSIYIPSRGGGGPNTSFFKLLSQIFTIITLLKLDIPQNNYVLGWTTAWHSWCLVHSGIIPRVVLAGILAYWLDCSTHLR